MAKNMELNIIMGAAVGGALSGLLKVKDSMKGVEKQSKILSETTQKLNEENKKLSDTQKSLKAFDDARRKLNSINLEYIKASKQLNILRKSYREVGETKAEFAKRVKDAETQVKKLNRQKEAQKHVFERARSSIETEGHSLKTYSDELVKVEKQLKKNAEAKKKLDEAQEKYSKMAERGKSIADGGTKVLGALAVPVKVYMDVEESQADLRKILGKEAELYYDKLAEITKNSPLSQVEVNEIAGALSQAGIKGNDIVEYTDKAQQMKVAFDMSTQQAGEFLAKTKEQLGLGKEELFSYMDTINMMSNKYPVTAEQLAEVSSRTAGFAKNINLAKESNMAFATSIMATGVNAEQTSTVLSKVYAELAQGADTKRKSSAFEFLGINPGSIEKEMARDAEGTIIKVLEKIKGANLADKTGLITDIFGGNASTINGVATLTNNLDGLKQKLGEVKQEAKGNETVTAEYQERLATLSNQLKIAKNNFMLSISELGASLAPLAKGFLEAVTPMLKGLADFIKRHPKVTSVITGSIAAVAGLGVAGGKLYQMFAKFKQLKSAFSFLKETGKFPKLFSIFSKTGGLLINPWILAGAVIVGIFVLLYTKSEWFRNGVNNAIKQIMPYVKELGNLLKNTLGKAITWVSDKTKEASPHMKKIWEALKPVLSAIGAVIKVVIITAIQLVIYYIKSMTATFKLIWTVASNVFKMVGAIIKTRIEVWKGIFNLFIAFFTGKWNEIPGIVKGILESVKKGINEFVESAKNILKGLFGWFSDKWNALKDLVSKNPITVKVKESWDKVTGGGKNPGQKWAGTNYFEGGLTTVAERGAELIKIPGQNPFLAQKEMLLNLPKGTRILNNSQTRSTLRDGVNKLKSRVVNLGSGNRNIGGDTIYINIDGANNSPLEIAKQVERILKERDNRKRRVAFG